MNLDDETKDMNVKEIQPPASAAARANGPSSKSGSRAIGRRGVRFLRTQWRSLLLIGFVLLVLIAFKAVLTPFVLSFALAYVLYPAVVRITRIRFGRHHVPVWAAILTVYIVLIGGAALLVSLTGPPVLAQLQKLIDNIPSYAAQANSAGDKLIARWQATFSTWVLNAEEAANEEGAIPSSSGDANDGAGDSTSEPPDASASKDGVETESSGAIRPTEAAKAVSEVKDKYLAKLQSWLEGLGAQMPILIEALIRSIFNFFLVLMLTFMFLIYFPRLFTFSRRLIPVQYRAEFEKIAGDVNDRLSGVVRGQLLICLVNGVLTYVGFVMIGVKFASLLAFVAGVLSLIPIFGTIISTIPAVLLGLTQSVTIGLSVLGWVVLIHILEAYVLNPLIMGDSAHMNPLLIVFALLVGSHYFHPIMGPLLAAPFAAIIQTVFLHFLTREEDHGVPEPSLAPPATESSALSTT